MMFRQTSREEFVRFITSSPADKFAKTFVAKADMQEIWDKCIGYWNNDVLMGAIIWTISKREPRTANLQLLHTFANSRYKRVAKGLCEYCMSSVFASGAPYFRVSAEPEAVPFYEKIGFKFIGKQKSGSHLSIFLMNGPLITDGLYIIDPYICKQIHKKGKGGCVVIFDKKV